MNRKRFRNTLFLFVALFLFMFGINSQKTFAAETNQNGVIVETKFDKESYQKGEKVIYSVYMQNTNSEVINIKNINVDVPDGYTISEESKDQSTKDIQPGDHVLLKYYIDEKKNSGGQDDINNGNTGSTDDKDNIKPGKPAKDDNTKKNPSSIGDKNSSPAKADKKEAKKNSVIEKVKTGDHAKILLWGIIMIIAFSVIIIIAIRSNNKKGLLSLLLIFATLSEIALSPISTKAADNPNQISLSDKFTVNETDKDISIQIQFEKQSNNVGGDTTTYTRGKWIQEILTAYGMNDVNLENASETHFTDIETSPYRDAIHIAEIYGIVDQGESFFPEEAVTREFAAVTTVRLLGYQGEGTPTCNDAENISHKSEVFLALKSGAFLLKDGYFNPQNPLNKMDKDQALKHIGDVVKSTEIDPSKNTGYVYKEDIIQLSSDIEYTDDGNYIKLPKNSQTEKMQKGQIFVINDESAYRINEITEENDFLKIAYQTPELNEILSSLSICDESKEIDWSKIKLADDVKIDIPEEDSSQNNISTESTNRIVTYDGETVVPIPHPKNPRITVSITKDYEASIYFKNMYGKYIIDADIDSGRLNNVYSAINYDSDIYITPIKGSLSPDKLKEPFKKCLFEVPVIGPLWVAVYFVVSLDGSISFEMNFENTGGIGIINNMPRYVFNAQFSSCNVNATVIGSIGVKGELSLSILKNKLINFSFTPKFRLKANSKGYVSNPKSCTDISDLQFIIDVSAFDDCILYKIIGITWTFTLFERDISPFHWKGVHVEVSEIDGYSKYSIVKACTRKGKEYNLKFLIKDSLTNQPLENAEVIIDNVSYLTNKDGYTKSINGNGNNINVIIQKNNYILKQIELNPDNYTDGSVDIKLTKIPEEATLYNGHYYKIFYGSYPWEKAKEKCEQAGGYLAAITSADEQQFINSLNKYNDRLWIGGTRGDKYLWTWTSGEPWMYENWAPGEPNNSENVISNENCVAIWNSKGQWNDLNNNNTYEQSGYICEWE